MRPSRKFDASSRPAWCSRTATARMLPRPLFLWPPLLCLLLFPATAAEAESRKLPYFRLFNYRGEVALTLGHDTDLRENTNQPRLDQSELILREEIAMGADGWIYHPALAGFSVDLAPVFYQAFNTANTGRSTKAYRNQLNYNASLSLLPYKPYPLTLFASQLLSQINSPFTARQLVDTLRYGADLGFPDLRIKEFEFPTHLIYRHQQTEISSLGGMPTSFRKRDEFEVKSDAETDRTINRLRYSWKNLETLSRGGSAPTSRHDFRLSQERSLDRGDLMSQFFLTGNTGRLDTLAINLNESLGLNHDYSLSSNYRYAFSYQDTSGSEQFSNTGQAAVTHQLYHSLTSGLRAQGNYSTSNLGRIWSAGGGGQLRYVKRIPHGSFGLRFVPQFIYTDEDVESGELSVLDERHEIVVGPLILLDKPLVVENTIVVTDPASLQTFTEGIDYNVVPTGIQTGIRVIPGSELDPAVPPLIQTMAVSYDYRTEPARTFTTLILATGASLHLWNHLAFDVSYVNTDQNLLEGIEDQFTLDDSQRILARLEATFDHNRTRLEYENFRSNITPFERVALTNDLNYRPTPYSSIGAGAGYDYHRISDTGRITHTFSLTGNGTAVLPFRILGRLNILFRYIDQPEQSSFGTGGTLSFTYRYGRLIFELKDRLTWRETNRKVTSDVQTRELVNTLYFRVARPF